MAINHASKTIPVVPSKCLLVIDDEADIREIVQLSLECTRSWTILVAASGKEGLAIARRHCPDAILLDMNLDDADGYEVVHQLRQDQQTALIPVLFLTAARTWGPKAQDNPAESLGIYGAIAKPFDPGCLANQIDELLQW